MAWTHIAVVYDDKQPKLYLNGFLVKAGLVSRRSFVYPSTWLGGRASETSNYGHYRGLLDEISIYNRALSAKEISSIYAAGTAGKCRVGPKLVSENVDNSNDQNSRFKTTGPRSNSNTFLAPTLAENWTRTPLANDLNFGYALPRGVGLSHGIEVSDDLVHWMPLTNAAFYFRDLESTNFQQRFYRFPER